MKNKKSAVTSQVSFSTIFVENKKGIGPVVATALLIVVAVVAVIGFQSWFGMFSSDVFVQTETKSSSSSSTNSIETIVGDQLYVKGSVNDNLSIKKITVDGNDCNIVMNITGVQNISLGNCLDNLTTNSPEVVIVTKDKVISKKIYLGNVQTISDSSVVAPPVVNSFFNFGMDTNLSQANASFLGEASSDISGNEISSVGDVNGDGFDDFIIAAYYNDEGGGSAGQTYLIFGHNKSWNMDISLSQSNASFIGENPSDNSGVSIGGVGDVNGDGFDDFIIAAYYNDEGGNKAGQTYLILGRSSGWQMDTNLSQSNASFIGENADDEAGNYISGVGDVNGDGFDDFLIGTYKNTEVGTNAGQTYLILGRSNGWQMDTSLSQSNASFLGEVAEDRSSVGISAAGDVNGDGFDDFLIGAFRNDESVNDAGQTYLILGRSSGWQMDTSLSQSNASFLGEGSGDISGARISGVGDVNGDGFDDFLIGASFNSEIGYQGGQTYLILGRSSGWQMDTSLSQSNASFLGEVAGDRSGDVTGVGDVNDDGFTDFLIGAHQNDEGGSNAGQVYLIFGRNSGWQMDINLSDSNASFLGEVIGDWSGSTVSGAGDVNSDGFDDLLIGAYQNDEGASNAGQTYLIFGGSTN